MVTSSFPPCRLNGFGSLLPSTDYRAYFLPQHLDPSEVESLRALLVFLGGVTLFAMCIMVEYIGQIAAKFNSNPQFVVREELHRSCSGAAKAALSPQLFGHFDGMAVLLSGFEKWPKHPLDATP